LPASNFNADGTITIYVPKSAVGNPQAGDLLGAVNGRTFTGDTPETMNLERSTALIDHTFVKAQTDNSYPAATYTVTGNTTCPTPTPTPAPTPTPVALPCGSDAVEDDNQHIAYSNGWHLINNPSASAGHYPLNEGGNNVHSAILTFSTTATQTGTIKYFYAKSQKGGSAEVFLDNADMGPVIYNGPTGSNRSPIFGASTTYHYGTEPNGQHKLEIKRYCQLN